MQKAEMPFQPEHVIKPKSEKEKLDYAKQDFDVMWPEMKDMLVLEMTKQGRPWKERREAQKILDGLKNDIYKQALSTTTDLTFEHNFKELDAAALKIMEMTLLSRGFLNKFDEASSIADNLESEDLSALKQIISPERAKQLQGQQKIDKRRIINLQDYIKKHPTTAEKEEKPQPESTWASKIKSRLTGNKPPKQAKKKNA